MNKQLRDIGEQAQRYIAEKTRVASDLEKRREQMETELCAIGEQWRADLASQREQVAAAVLAVIRQRGMQRNLARELRVSAGYFGDLQSRMGGDALLERIAALAERPADAEERMMPLQVTAMAQYLFAHSKEGGITTLEVLNAVGVDNTPSSRRFVDQTLLTDGWGSIRISKGRFCWCPPECNVGGVYGRAVLRRDYRQKYLAREAELEAQYPVTADSDSTAPDTTGPTTTGPEKILENNA